MELPIWVKGLLAGLVVVVFVILTTHLSSPYNMYLLIGILIFSIYLSGTTTVREYFKEYSILNQWKQFRKNK